MFLRIDDLTHLCLTNQHLLLYEPLRFHLSHLDIHAALVTKVMLRRIKNLFVFRQRLCKHTRQETHSRINHLVPLGKGFERPRLPCLHFLSEGFVFRLKCRLQRFQKGRRQLEVVADIRLNHGVRRHHILIVEIVEHECIGGLQVRDRFARYGKLLQDFQQHMDFHRVEAKRRRRFHRAFPCLRALEAFFSNRPACHGFCAAF